MLVGFVVWPVYQQIYFASAICTGALAVLLIAERPSLSGCESVGDYITFHPNPGTTTDAERN
jgi:ethanolamine ammonia-lyase small subunit